MPELAGPERATDSSTRDTGSQLHGDAVKTGAVKFSKLEAHELKSAWLTQQAACKLASEHP